VIDAIEQAAIINPHKWNSYVIQPIIVNTGSLPALTSIYCIYIYSTKGKGLGWEKIKDMTMHGQIRFAIVVVR
jgi:hypothetical protein